MFYEVILWTNFYRWVRKFLEFLHRVITGNIHHHKPVFHLLWNSWDILVGNKSITNKTWNQSLPIKAGLQNSSVICHCVYKLFCVSRSATPSDQRCPFPRFVRPSGISDESCSFAVTFWLPERITTVSFVIHWQVPWINNQNVYNVNMTFLIRLKGLEFNVMHVV